MDKWTHRRTQSGRWQLQQNELWGTPRLSYKCKSIPFLLHVRGIKHATSMHSNIVCTSAALILQNPRPECLLFLLPHLETGFERQWRSGKPKCSSQVSRWFPQDRKTPVDQVNWIWVLESMVQKPKENGQLWSHDCLGLGTAWRHFQVEKTSKLEGKRSICKRYRSRLCIWDHIQTLLNLMGTWTSETVQWSAITWNSALLAMVLAFSSARAELLTVSTPALSAFPCRPHRAEIKTP